jgi:hypothetical protein
MNLELGLRSVLVSVAACAVVPLAASRQAHAERLQIAADLTSCFGAGQVSELASPSVGGTATARWVANGWLSLGITGGLRRNVLATTDEAAPNQRAQLTATTTGGTIRITLPDVTSGTRPYFSLDGGYARFRTDHPDFDTQPMASGTTGLFATPQVGITTMLGRHLSFEASIRYEYLRAKAAMEIGDDLPKDLSGAGLAAGFAYAL